MNIEELKKCALQWAEENEGNRAVMLITIERGETDDEGNYGSEITSLVNGNEGLCSTALKQVLTDKRERTTPLEKSINTQGLIFLLKKWWRK